MITSLLSTPNCQAEVISLGAANTIHISTGQEEQVYIIPWELEKIYTAYKEYLQECLTLSSI